MISAFWGAFLISLMIVTIGQTFELTRNQKKAMHHLFLTRKAAASITCAMRYYMAKKRSKITQAQDFHRGHGSVTSPRLQVFSTRDLSINPGNELEEELMISERVEA